MSDFLQKEKINGFKVSTINNLNYYKQIYNKLYFDEK